MEQRSHKEVIASMTKALSHLSTHTGDVEYLGSPEHKEYQECWQRFHSRYHDTIVRYILKKAHWGEQKIHEAEGVAQDEGEVHDNT